ncbi:hypothetical protein C0J52_16646 [Blattella germanica]|nr:hypothetical protein C0J52_16646 [Blattella germanica]
MLRRSSRKCVTYTKDELENMKFLELKKIAKQRNLSRRFTTKHEIIDSLLNFGLEDDLSLETLTLVDNSDSEHDNSTNENESKNLSPVIQTQEKNVSQPKRVVRKGNGRYFESPWHSVMTKSPEVSLNKSRASSAKKNKSLTQLLAGYCQPQSTTASPYPTRNRRSTRNFTPASSATRITRRTRANAESEQELYNTLNQSPYPKKYTAKKSFVTEPSMLEDEARSDVINKNRTTVGTALQYDTIQLEEQKSSEENKTEQNFIIDELRNQESILSQSSVSPFEGTQNVQSGRRLRSRVVNAEIKASPIKEAKAVEEESPTLDETFEIIEEVDSSKVNIRDRGNVSNLRSLRASDKTSPSNELKTSKSQEKSDNKENESTVDLKLNGTYELPEAQNTTLPMLKEVSNSVKRRSRSFPRETSKKFAAVFFSPPNHEVNKRSQKKDFKKIHKKEFEKMESLVDNHERKLQRAKKLATPNKFGVMVFKGAQPTDKNDQLPKPAAQSSTGFQFNLHDRFIPQVNMKSWNVRPSPQPVKYFIQKQNVREVKEIITKKLPVHNRRENIREESRTKIRGVRLNRRFELQMAHRKIN